MKAKLIKTSNDYLLKEYGYGETLAITSGTMEGRKLSLKNCESIANGYDLDELACNEIRIDISIVKDIDAKRKENSSPCIPLNEGGCVGSNLYNQVKGFEKGFQKALELMGDDVFSWLEKKGYLSDDKDILKEEYNHQTEWDVEICTLNDCQGDFKQCNNENFTCILCTDTGLPKLDENGCLILKQI